MSDNNADLNAAVSSLAQRDLRPSRNMTRLQVQSLVEQVVGQTGGGGFVQFEPSDVASGHDEVDWTTFDASTFIPPGASSAYIWSKATTITSDDQVTIEFRRDASGGTFPGAQTEQMDGSQDSDRDTLLRFLPLTTGRTFDYRVTGTLTETTSQWEIKLEGYI